MSYMRCESMHCEGKCCINSSRTAMSFHIYFRLYLHHLPSLPPEKFSMICLTLFQHLCGLHHLMTANLESEDKENRNVGMEHMWKIALKANNTGKYNCPSPASCISHP